MVRSQISDHYIGTFVIFVPDEGEFQFCNREYDPFFIEDEWV